MTSNAEQINILFVSATVPYPATDGGRIRVLNLISRLCRIHKVTLLTFNALPGDEEGIKYLREMGVEVIGVRCSQHKLRSALRSILQNLFQGKPLTVAKYYSVEMLETLENLLKSRKFEIIHFEMLHTGQFLPKLAFGQKPKDVRAVRTVLGEQNIDSDVWFRLAREESNLLKKLIFYSQYRSFKRYENRICRYFDLCACVSAQDQQKLESICPEALTELVPNGVDPDYFRPGEAEADEKSLVFTGSMDWQPNEDAVIYFCNHILPLVRSKLPEVKFYIVGSNPTDRVLKLGENQGAIVTGSVEDVRPYIESSAVYVVPLRIGGGTRLKILQALAMDKAVISTSIGCEGLGLEPDEHLLVADEAQSFAESVVRLAKDKALRHRLGENGRRLVLEKYDWDVIVEGLIQVYMGLIPDKTIH